jgi:hypothetical protein
MERFVINPRFSIKPRLVAGAVVLGAGLLSACGGGSGDAAAEPPAIVRAQAAAATAQGNSLCTAVQPFYWEVGDGSGVLASGGSPAAQTTYTRDSSMLIASASKWWFGAYVAQLRAGVLSAADLEATRMMSGYHSLNYVNCLRASASGQAAETVQQCFQTGGNDTYTADDKGRFYYDSGHFQKYASVDLGLGALNSAQLAAAMATQLGSDIGFEYDSPQLAAGGVSSAARYAKFLQKILRGELRIKALLGSNKVCTQVGAACPNSVSTPTPAIEAWHYSIGHWVEDTPPSTQTLPGDGAFSSPGAFGFYPWINADATRYGILARYSTDSAAYIRSLYCGGVIRRAYESGTALLF